MEFDEYEYLENTVENPEHKRSEDKKNGGDGIVDYEEKDRSRSSKHRSDDDVDDSDRTSKRSRSRKESDHEKDRSSRHGTSSRDREKGEKDRHTSSREHRTRDKEESNGKERNRDRDRDRERDGDRKRNGNRERREREPERDRNREEELERNKRNRNHSERHHDEKGREKSKDVETVDTVFMERRRERVPREQDHENRRYKEKKEDKVEPEVDPERDQRTVFAYQISLKAGERDLFEFFSKAGKVRDVQLIMDRNTRRSKGIGYIEFCDVMSVPMAIAMSGQLLLGHPVMVKPSEAEKNLVQSTTAVSGGLLGPYSGGARRLYVGNLPITIKEDQLRQVFEPFGLVELVQMPTDPGTGNCKGYAFIQFGCLEDSKAAQNLNGQLEIAGRVIKVSAVTDQAGMQEAGANMADFDDDETGLSLNAQSRALLMQKLDRTGAASSFTGSSAASYPGQTSVQVLPGLSAAGLSIPALSAPPIETIGVPSECLLLKNMFEPSAETEPDFDLDIKEDVQDECSKFGKLKHIHVEKHSAGFVYLRFETAQAAIAAQRALHGRWFAGKMITATFMFINDYDAKFPGNS